MAKKRNRRNPRGKRSFPPDRPTGLPRRSAVARAAKAALDAGLPQLDDPAPAAEHMRRAMIYETWLKAGRDITDLPANDIPSTYLRFFDVWPQDAFEFYRHRYFSRLVWLLGGVPWLSFTQSVVRRLAQRDPVGFSNLKSTLNGTEERFWRQNINAEHYIVATAEAQSEETRLTAGLQAWAAIYEVDMPIWLLGVLGKGISTGRIYPMFGGGPQSMTQQGSLVDSVGPTLVGTPLEKAFAQTYDTDLRNAMSHNDWELVHEGEKFTFVDHRTGRRWTEQECWDRIETGQVMLQSLLLLAQLIINDALQPDRFSDVGVLSATSWWPTNLDQPADLVILQLWCFHELDPPGSWLDRTSAVIELGSDGSIIRLANAAVTYGSSGLDKHLLNGSRVPWIRVIRVPVAPVSGLQLPTVTTSEGETYEVAGATDEHVLPLELRTNR